MMEGIFLLSFFSFLWTSSTFVVVCVQYDVYSHKIFKCLSAECGWEKRKGKEKAKKRRLESESLNMNEGKMKKRDLNRKSLFVVFFFDMKIFSSDELHKIHEFMILFRFSLHFFNFFPMSTSFLLVFWDLIHKLLNWQYLYFLNNLCDSLIFWLTLKISKNLKNLRISNGSVISTQNCFKIEKLFYWNNF